MEEYQKLYDLSVQDGTLNNETLLEMGFGTDSNNKMVKNSYYIEYLNIANQYNRGSYIDDGNNVYNYDSQIISFDNDFNSNYNEKENMWNQMSEDDRKKNEIIMLETLKKVDTATQLYETLLPDASLALGHFIDKNNFGKTLTFNNTNQIFDLYSDMKNMYVKSINRNLRAAEHFTQDVETADFAMNEYIGAGISMGPNIDRVNWFMALGGFVFGTKGTVVRTGNSYMMDLTYEIKDYYDWAGPEEDPRLFPLYIDIQTVGDKQQILVTEYVNEVDLYNLHYAGFAKNFLTSGSFTINLTWTKGDVYQ